MEGISPKARFDLLAGLVDLDESSIDQVRHSIRHLLPHMSELIRTLHGALKRNQAPAVIGELDAEALERLQSQFASFVMRTIGCNFDDDYCDWAVEISHHDGVPPRLYPLALALAGDFVSRTLAAAVDDREQLAAMLGAWQRLLAVLSELTR